MTLVYGHRGFSGEYPENTLLAFEKAAEVGAEGIEFDVQLTSDGIPVVMHDENTLRTTGQDHWIKDITCQEFQSLNADYVKQCKHGYVAPPTLRETMEICKKTGLRMNIELKTGVFEYDGIEQKVIDMLSEFGLKETTLISSFNHFSIQRVKQIDSSIRTGALDESWLVNAGKYVKSIGADDLNPYVKFLSPETVKELRENGCKINTWTVNTEEDMKKVLELGIDIGISNFPDKFLKIRKSFNA